MAEHSAPLPMLVDAREAARLLGIGARLLWSLSAPRGPLPVVRVGRRVLYRVEALREWAATQERGGRA